MAMSYMKRNLEQRRRKQEIMSASRSFPIQPPNPRIPPPPTNTSLKALGVLDSKSEREDNKTDEGEKKKSGRAELSETKRKRSDSLSSTRNHEFFDQKHNSPSPKYKKDYSKSEEGRRDKKDYNKSEEGGRDKKDFKDSSVILREKSRRDGNNNNNNNNNNNKNNDDDNDDSDNDDSNSDNSNDSTSSESTSSDSDDDHKDERRERRERREKHEARRKKRREHKKENRDEANDSKHMSDDSVLRMLTKKAGDIGVEMIQKLMERKIANNERDKRSKDHRYEKNDRRVKMQAIGDGDDDQITPMKSIIAVLTNPKFKRIFESVY